MSDVKGMGDDEGVGRRCDIREVKAPGEEDSARRGQGTGFLWQRRRKSEA